MLLIWGSTGRASHEGSGKFFCPVCNSDEYYDHYCVATYFTLYFIPLFETGTAGEYVKCSHCENAFERSVLDYVPPTPAERMLDSIRRELESGTSLQAVRTQLLNSGMDQNMTDEMIAWTAGDRRPHCTACSLTFIQGIGLCSGCGNAVGTTPPPTDNRVQSTPTRKP